MVPIIIVAKHGFVFRRNERKIIIALFANNSSVIPHRRPGKKENVKKKKQNITVYVSK